MTPAPQPSRGVFDSPDALEILGRVARFLDEEVYGLVGDQKVNYRVRVAANLLRLVAREVDATDVVVDPTGRVATEAIVRRHGGVDQLAARLADGSCSIVDPEVYEELRAYTDLKVDVAAIRRRDSTSRDSNDRTQRNDKEAR